MGVDLALTRDVIVALVCSSYDAIEGWCSRALGCVDLFPMLRSLLGNRPSPKEDENEEDRMGRS